MVKCFDFNCFVDNAAACANLTAFAVGKTTGFNKGFVVAVSMGMKLESLRFKSH